MIKHCGNLFGAYFGMDTSRSYRQPTHRQHSYRQPSQRQQAHADPFPVVSHPLHAEHQQSGPNTLTGFTAGMIENAQQASEPEPMSLDSMAQRYNAQQQKTARKAAVSKPAPIDVDAMSSHSSDSGKSVTARDRGKAGSIPSSPSRRQSSASGDVRSSRDLPWLQGRQAGQVANALQKNKVRCSSPNLHVATFC